MQVNKFAVVTMAGAAMFGTLLSSAVAAEQAPKDRSIAFPTEKLAAIKGSNETLVEGPNGKYSVSLRRIEKSDGSPSTDSKSINLWYVQDGSGSVTVSGKNGSVTDNLKAGDIEFIPAGLAHRLNSNGITMLAVRWTMTGRAPWAPAIRRCRESMAAPLSSSMRRPTGPCTFRRNCWIPTSPAGLAEEQQPDPAHDRRRSFQHQHPQYHRAIYRIPQNHDRYWVVLEGSGTANTGLSTSSGDMHTEPARTATRTAGTGVEAPAKVGDVFFVPSNFTHGFSTVNKRMVWLNIRWDDDYAK